MAKRKAKVLAEVQQQRLNRPLAPEYPSIRAPTTPDNRHGSLQRYLPEGSTLGMVVGAQKPECSVV